MSKCIISWDDVKDSCPLPHYIKPGSNIDLKTDGGNELHAKGYCLFPKNDPTLILRKQVNHFHSVLLLNDVVFALNVIWNMARVVAPEKGWKNMVSVKTETRVFHPIEIGQEYAFYLSLKPMKGKFKEVKLRIVSDETEYISVITTVSVE